MAMPPVLISGYEGLVFIIAEKWGVSRKPALEAIFCGSSFQARSVDWENESKPG